MSDFVFSTRFIEKNRITKEIQSIYKTDKPFVEEFHGEWGSFGISKNLYNGFNPYQDDEYIVAVIGGPILMFRENNFINDKDSSEGTVSIYHRWLEGKMKWDEDLSGPFVVIIIDKITREVLIVTDLMSFIPVYIFKNSEDFMLSTHVDVLARISGQNYNLDLISQIDFILHGVVTYPYTFYKKIRQLSPSSEHKIKVGMDNLLSQYYWIPKEDLTKDSLKEVAVQLKKSLFDYLKRIVSQTTNIAQFISGGEDTRLLSAMLQNTRRDAFIFLDNMNREGKIAEKVSKIYGANFKLFTRGKLHYLEILNDCSELVGSGAQYFHAHTYGFHKNCNLQKYTAVFGGLFSDALLKGTRIKKIGRTGKLPLLPELKNKNYSAEHQLENFLFNEDSLSELRERRKAHLELIKSFRSQSVEEWFELWPSSMNSSIPNIHANRRLFRSYEPFMSNEVVKIAAIVPQKWKLNRKLFHIMAKPFFQPTKWVMHGGGWFPYYSWKSKSIVFPIVYIYRKIGKIVGYNKGNQGPWLEWNVVITSQKWFNNVKEYSAGVKKLNPVLAIGEEEFIKEINNNFLSIQQRVNMLQTLYFNTKI